MKKFTILLFLFPALIFAQGYNRSGSSPKLSVSGLVIDSLTNKPLSFAALSFISPQDDQLITGGICNEEGRFIIEEVPVGRYKLLVEYMGYVPKIISQVKVRPNKNSKDNYLSTDNSKKESLHIILKKSVEYFRKSLQSHEGKKIAYS